MFNKQFTRVAFLICICFLCMYCSVVKADTIRHVYYGGDCSTGKINCNGWIITIMKNNSPTQQVTLTKDTNGFQIHYDYERLTTLEGKVTAGKTIGLIIGAVAGAAPMAA